MKEYAITFKQYHTYWVNADDEDAAFDEAYKQFRSDMYCSVANAYYDDYEVECEDEDEDE